MAKQQENESTDDVAKGRRQVGLLVQTANDWHRQILRGVANFAHEHGGWDFYIEPRGFFEEPRIPSGWRGDGVITRLTSEPLTQAIRDLGVPAVNVSWLGTHSPEIPQVVSDEAACGRMAAEHLLELGFVHLAYVRPLGRPGYGDLLGKAYAARAEESNAWAGDFPDAAADLAQPPHEWRDELAAWLVTLPRPVGLLVWNSNIGREVTVACSKINLHVPDDVAIVCSEHDALMSSLATIPLSNLDQSPSRVGYKAAELLERLMQGEAPPADPIFVPPVGVVLRQSSDTMATEDRLVADAIRFIRQNCQRPIKVVDVRKFLGISRRSLEHRFSQVVGRSPAAVIRRARVERAKRLLIETDLPVVTIAGRTGFNHAEVLIRTFRRELGISPGEFRKRW